MNPEELRGSILTMRQAIRRHRDTKGDDRCWLDDFLVWKILSDSPDDLTVLPAYEDAMSACRSFFELRRSSELDPVPVDAIVDSAHWDEDLVNASEEQLGLILAMLSAAIRVHRDIKERPRTIEDDRKLYAVLPEKLPADFRLPTEGAFLGTEVEGAGCPNFWKSHGCCPCTTHNLHAWGPCCKDK